MKLTDFDYQLGVEKIATRPVSPKHDAKLLASVRGHLSDQTFLDLPDLLHPGDLLILNDTRVVPTRLRGVRKRDTEHGSGLAQIELTLIERLGEESWLALGKPAKRLVKGDVIEFGAHKARVVSRDGPNIEVTSESDGALSFSTLFEIGSMPLPPYIAKQREADAQDVDDYQTLFAKNDGAVAAPTASLHFTETVFERLAVRGINHSFVTLHVGAGTFLPVTENDIANHKMHSEWYDLPQTTADAMKRTWNAGGRVIPVGTTAMRTIESSANGFRKISMKSGDTDIFITPGYGFKASDGLITNFHLPKSTLLMLVAAFAGFDQMKAIYDHALQADYRFFSYGDSSLILP